MYVLWAATQDAAGNPKDVFLYNKAHLKANVQLPEPEDIPVPHADGKRMHPIRPANQNLLASIGEQG